VAHGRVHDRPPDQSACAAEVEAEGDLVHLLETLVDAVEFGIVGSLARARLDDRVVHEVLEAGLERAVEVGVAQHLRAGFALQVEVTFENDLVLGQGTRLVGAEDVDGAEVLDGIELLDDDLLVRHAHGTLGQTRRDQHGQHLGRETHGDGDGKEKCLEPIALGEAVDEENRRHHHEHEADEKPRDALDALGKRRLGWCLGELRGHLAEHGGDARRHDEARGTTR